jgi:hypothetical protein
MPFANLMAEFSNSLNVSQHNCLPKFDFIVKIRGYETIICSETYFQEQLYTAILKKYDTKGWQ